MSKADLIILVRRRNTHFDFAKIFCSIKCYHLKIKSQFKLGILKHHDIRCHWCEAWFLTFWSICQSGKVGLVGFFQKVNIKQYALGGHHIAYRHCHRWFRWFLIYSLVPLWALIFGSLLLPPLSIRARWFPCCCSFTFIQPRGVKKYFSDNQSDSRNG